MNNNLIENDIETYLVKRAKEANGLCYKFVSPQNSGVPDRILIIKGYTIYIETKKPGKKARLLQRKKHNEMKKCGALILVIDSKEQIDELFEIIKKKRKLRKCEDLEKLSLS